MKEICGQIIVIEGELKMRVTNSVERQRENIEQYMKTHINSGVINKAKHIKKLIKTIETVACSESNLDDAKLAEQAAKIISSDLDYIKLKSKE